MVIVRSMALSIDLITLYLYSLLSTIYQSLLH